MILRQTRSTFRLVRTAVAEFDLHAGNMKFSTQNEESISIHIIICIILQDEFRV